MSGATYTCEDGQVCRNGYPMHPQSAARLLALFRKDAANTGDWFHKRAREIADQIEQAMREAGIIEERDAA